jgi:sigma-B regulation protein RsbU (phosphoserine phosphatase)
MQRIKCSEIWGGIKNADCDVCSAGITASLFSSACSGGKGGDAYYFSVCGSDKLTRLALADVVGHGEQVSEISGWVYDQLESHMNDIDQPAMMAALNHRVADRGYRAMTTAVIVSYYLNTGLVYFTYAGHPPMFSRSGSGRWRQQALPEADGARNLPLGVSSDIPYDMGDAPLVKGDRLFLFSDGLVEAAGAGGEQFGADRLRAALDAAGDAGPMKLKTHVLDAVRNWTGGGLSHDDVTLIAIELQ